MEQPHVDRLRSILIAQLTMGFLGGWIPFYLSGTLCPDGCCRLVDAAKICGNRKNLGEEMLENEG